jgi:hypothetical protein
MSGLPEHAAKYRDCVLLECAREGCDIEREISWGDLEPGSEHACACGYRWKIKAATETTKITAEHPERGPDRYF